MKIKSFSTYHLVKSEDLNHHGTLYAGRSAEWFVEAGFIPAQIWCARNTWYVYKFTAWFSSVRSN